MMREHALAMLAMLASLIWAPPATADARQALDQVAAREALVQTVGWRLARGNAAFCENAPPAIGLTLLDTAQFDEPEVIRATLKLSGPVAVLAVGDDSPAARAGLRPFDGVATLGELRVAAIPAREGRDWRRATMLHDHVDRMLARDGAVAIDGAAVTGVSACATRWELRDGSTTLAADGTRVLVGDAFPGLGYPEDEFAAALAHELAHNILRHPARLEHDGRTRRNVRRTEREADRMTPWLLASAGYDPAAAARLIARSRPRHGGGLFRRRTHDGWDERIEAIEAELPRIAAAIARSGTADWSLAFRPWSGP